MIIWNDININCFVYDIETPKSMFYALFYNPDTKQFIEFEISKNRNDIIDLIKFLDDYKDSYFISYNGLRFDAPILTEIKNKGALWNNKDIIDKIFDLSQKIIEGQNNNKFFEYPETSLFAPQLDLMKILHYDNKNRSDNTGEGSTGMVSLKRIQFEMDSENIEENPIDFKKEEFTDEEIQQEKDYCKNDVLRTTELFFNVIGKTEHPLYKDNNQIELRYNIMQEFNIPCMNYSDAKIGDEIIKTTYAKELNIPYKDLPKKGTFRRKIQLKNCVPSFVKFKADKLKEFLKRLKKEEINAKDEFHREIELGGVIHDLKKGGIHSRIENQIYESNSDYQLIDIDVSSFYAIATILSNKTSKHLNFKAFIKAYIDLYIRRVTLKPLAKKDKKIKGIVEGLKASLVAIFGKSGDIDSWALDKEMMYSITIGGELIILMLMESLEMNNYKIVMSNTDGFLVYIKKDQIPKFREICNNFTEYMNSVLKELGHPKEIEFLLEESFYNKIIFSNVNNYLAVYEDGSYKFKGAAFKSDYKFHENKSARVVNLAVNDYFINKTLPEQYINNYNNIYDFCLRQKANRNFNYELRNPNSEEIIKLKQLVRYFISKEGYKLMKIKSPECETNAAPVSNVHAPDSNNFQPLVAYCNKMPQNKELLLKEVDYWWYVDEAYKIIDKIEHRKFKTRRPQLTQQLGLQF